ncbi:hypothetical protein ACOSP7_009132 [Xanthoceras sorbifolium]|uniref:Pentatricopeptide repeat-containing protein n=1 Tax=Xanthoceras sorbifolium TaxID=99658 RepID=A0ABQ8HVE7_9ROSI|nr:hypothetical protein JRO89_XS07G0278500 [Xanthoceras sorbifolium]
MELSKSSRKKLTYLSISNPFNYLFLHSPQSSSSLSSPQFKTLVSPKPCQTSIFNRTQFLTEPTSHPYFPSISSTGSSSFCSPIHPSSLSSQFSSFSSCNGCKNQILNLRFLKSYSYNRFRWFSLASFGNNNSRVGDVTPKQVSDFIELIRSGDDEMESKLTSMNVSLSVASAVEIFRVLNSEKISALRFLDWIKLFQPELYCNSDVCSLAIDNCGRLDDYETMRCLLGDFGVNQVCLTDKAFGFLNVMISSKASTRKCISRVVEVLNRVGGSCCVSGVRALIEMLSVLGSFEMAKYVIIKTSKKLSYYNILIREMCLRHDFRGAQDLLNEMRQVGCEPSTLTYNYIISSLCKNGKNAEALELFKEMQERNYPPDAATYEIFIWNSCRLGEFDVAFQYLDDMAVRGLEPRHSTHAAFIKSYFSLQRFKEAYEYVVNSADKYKRSSNVMYSWLASLHLKNNNGVMAHNVLLEMMNKGLRPHFTVYIKVLKSLRKSGRDNLAGYLTTAFSSLRSESSVEAK